MKRWKPKSCPRCLGDIFIDNDLDGWYEECVQCSYRHELEAEAGSKEIAGQVEVNAEPVWESELVSS